MYEDRIQVVKKNMDSTAERQREYEGIEVIAETDKIKGMSLWKHVTWTRIY